MEGRNLDQEGRNLAMEGRNLDQEGRNLDQEGRNLDQEGRTARIVCGHNLVYITFFFMHANLFCIPIKLINILSIRRSSTWH